MSSVGSIEPEGILYAWMKKVRMMSARIERDAERLAIFAGRRLLRRLRLGAGASPLGLG